MTFSENIRMTRLISLFNGDAKRAIQSIRLSSLFYASGLKTIKRDFGDPLLVATLRMKRLFDKPQINRRDHNTLRVSPAAKNEQYLVNMNGIWDFVAI